jgi:hypothetical protein
MAFFLNQIVAGRYGGIIAAAARHLPIIGME